MQKFENRTEQIFKIRFPTITKTKNVAYCKNYIFLIVCYQYNLMMLVD